MYWIYRRIISNSLAWDNRLVRLKAWGTIRLSWAQLPYTLYFLANSHVDLLSKTLCLQLNGEWYPNNTHTS